VKRREEIEQRLKSWEYAKRQFSPHFVICHKTLDRLIFEFNWVLGDSKDELRSEESVRKRLASIERKLGISKEKRFFSRCVRKELSWILVEDDHGLLGEFIWDFLTRELHDAICTMRWEGPDLILEGIGDPPDFETPRGFNFWLKFKNGQFQDERDATDPIETIFLLYPDWAEGRYVITAQDDTLTGIILFSGDTFQYRMWDHGPPKVPYRQ
jgi:hypothetical protein